MLPGERPASLGVRPTKPSKFNSWADIRTRASRKGRAERKGQWVGLRDHGDLCVRLES
jgi:hypothetical protein